MQRKIEEFEQKIGYVFRDKSILRTALTHSSYANELKAKAKNQNSECNERLEFLGDSVLSIIVSEYLFEKYASSPEGELTKLRAAVVQSSALASYAKSIELGEFLYLGVGEEKNEGRGRQSNLENAFEALLAAIYLDAGENGKETVQKFLLPFIVSEIQKVTSKGVHRDYKTELQQLIQQAEGDYLEYITVDEQGPDHRKIYERACLIGGEIFGTGRGKNTKIADTAAAEAALIRLKKECQSSEPIPDDAPARLKSHSQKNKLPSPEFRDLGETENSSNTDKEYAVECRYGGVIKKGIGKSKQDARARASQSVLEELGIMEKKKQSEATRHAVGELQKAIKAKAKSKASPKITVSSAEKKRSEEPTTLSRKPKNSKPRSPRRNASPKGTQQRKHKRQQ